MFALIRPDKTLWVLFILCMCCSDLVGQDSAIIAIKKANVVPPGKRFVSGSTIAHPPVSVTGPTNTSPLLRNSQSFQYLSPARTQMSTSVACPDSSFLKIFEAQDRAYNFYTSAKTNDGGIVIGGYGRNKLTGPPYTWYSVITKFDSVGGHTWSKELQSQVISVMCVYMERIAPLADGSILVTGWQDKPWSTSPPTATVDYIAAKLTTNGDL